MAEIDVFGSRWGRGCVSMIQAVVILWLATGWVEAHPCPDGSTCSDEETCCKSRSGKFACCPMPEAVCCSDGLHCCPANTTCDLAHSACVQGFNLVSWVKKTPANYPSTSKAVCCGDEQHCCPEGFRCEIGGNSCIKNSDENEKAVICPDGASECPEGSTCCLLPSDQWGCCPLEKAVCCTDRLHCCPFQTKCDLKMSKCLSSYGLMEMWEKVPAHRRFPVKNLGDQDVQCSSDGHTCCQLPSGEVGCCPSPDAVCCPDHIHCCPTGTTCDGETQTCKLKDSSIPWLTKLQATVKDKALDVACNSTVSCDTGSTCCHTVTGGWSCCPLPQAVCCKDHIHCCPADHTCNLAKLSCDTPGFSIPWVTKVPATVRDDKALKVMCDETASCPKGTTCCRQLSGHWGCCPLPEAVCCPDHIHCCPTGTTCDGETQTCKLKDSSIPWLTKLQATVKDKALDVACNSTVSCDTGSTCCHTVTGGWSCCPLPQAVCCKDHIHCCPAGHTCNLAKLSCDTPGFSIAWVAKVPATVRDDKTLKVVCDETASCPKGTTCCRQLSGHWGCCPLPEAVCCDDREHCCPQGYTCNKAKCESHGETLPWFTKIPATKELSAPGIRCDEKTTCPPENTCCKQSSAEWSCCPLPQAVCCEDREHCCPTGYTCNVGAGTCEKRGLSGIWVLQVPSVSASDRNLPAVTCDDTHHCSSPATCCRSASGWACCPYTQAVCCGDLFCCPQGYVCDIAQRECVKKPRLNWNFLVSKHKKGFISL